MFSLHQYLFPNKATLNDLMSVRLMSEKDIKAQNDTWRLKAALCCIYAGVLVSIMFVLSGHVLNYTNRPGWFAVIGMALILVLSVLLCGMTMVVLIGLCLGGVHEKLGKVSETFKLNGVSYSACGYVHILMEKIKECSGKVYKDDVISQPREFTRMDLWALENIYKVEQREAECKELYIKA